MCKAHVSGITNDWGATATSLPLLGGLVTQADVQRGYINHALAISLGQDPKSMSANPWPAEFENTYPSTILELFAWGDLQALQTQMSCAS